MRHPRRVLSSLMRAALGDWLNGWMQRKGFNQKQLAELVGATEGGMSMILKGRRRPPKRRIANWAVVMGLNVEEARQFTELAYLAHCPDWIVREYLEMKAKLATASPPQ